jgi:Ser/Thr protein kinase RdoA (MazF antagonist)
VTLPDPHEASWAALCDRTLGTWHGAEAFPTQRTTSSVWRVRDSHGQDFVVKQHLTRTRHDREVHAYRHWTMPLDGHVPSLIAADDANLAVLLEAIPGTPADRARLDAAERAVVHHRAGALLRTLHGTPLGDLPPHAQEPAGHPADRLRQRFIHWRNLAGPQLTDDDIRLLDRAALPLADLGDLPVGVCHLDYQPHNRIVGNSPSTDLHVIDFEHTRPDITVRDLVRLEVRCWATRPPFREAFFDGYGRQLDDREVQALHACAAIDVLSSLVRGQATGNHSLVRHAHTTMGWLRDRHNGGGDRNSASARVLEQLHAPDATGRDLELLRTRSYRFSDNPIHYVIAEALEDRYRNGFMPSPRSLHFVRESLEQVRRDGTLPDIDPELLASCNFDPENELLRRASFTYRRYLPGPEPEMVVAVIGAPRSGTSHLVNLLASTGRFAYFTTASCWAWPTWNLHHQARTTLSGTSRATARSILSVDNKRTRIIPGLVMPGEAEDVYARVAPVYRHLGGHRYLITKAAEGDLDILRAASAAHLEHFQRRTLLTKSPFNSLRIPILESIWPGKVRYIHIIRDRMQAAESMRRNHFEFGFSTDADPAEHAWDHFVDAIRQAAPKDRLLTVTHENVSREPASTLAALLSWLGQE